MAQVKPDIETFAKIKVVGIGEAAVRPSTA